MLRDGTQPELPLSVSDVRGPSAAPPPREDWFDPPEVLKHVVKSPQEVASSIQLLTESSVDHVYGLDMEWQV